MSCFIDCCTGHLQLIVFLRRLQQMYFLFLSYSLRKPKINVKNGNKMFELTCSCTYHIFYSITVYEDSDIVGKFT